MNYRAEARDDALNMVGEFEEQIAEMLAEKGEASTDINNDYPNGDSYHHETHVDKYYNLQEAAELLNELDEFEETDSAHAEAQLSPRLAMTKHSLGCKSMAVQKRQSSASLTESRTHKETP